MVRGVGTDVASQWSRVVAKVFPFGCNGSERSTGSAIDDQPKFLGSWRSDRLAAQRPDQPSGYLPEPALSSGVSFVSELTVARRPRELFKIGWIYGQFNSKPERARTGHEFGRKIIELRHHLLAVYSEVDWEIKAHVVYARSGL